MPLVKIDSINRVTDEAGRLVETYNVEADIRENVETIAKAYGPGGVRLPQKGDPNRFRQRANNPKMTYVDKVRITHDGKKHNNYKVVVSYSPPNESGDSDDPNNVGTNYPWNEPTGMSQSGDIIMLASNGTDKSGQPWKYSNGGLVVTEVPTPITNLNIIRKPLKSKRNSFELSSEFFQTINSSNETIDGTTYPKHTLLVQAFDVELARFNETDPASGNTRITSYYVESIALAYNKNKWFEYVVDEGIMAKREVKDGDGATVDKFIPVTDDTTGTLVTQSVALNGEGQAIFDGKGDVVNNAKTSGKTPQQVVVSSELSIGGSGADSQTVLVFAPYEEKSFSGLKLNEGL